MSDDLAILLRRIHELADRQVEAPPKPLLAEMENTLTDGYARALALEAESTRIQKRIAELAADIETGDQALEIRKLAGRLTEARGDLDDLRASLHVLRRRADSLRSEANGSLRAESL